MTITLKCNLCIICNKKVSLIGNHYHFCKKCIKTYSPSYLNFYATGYDKGYDKAIKDSINLLNIVENNISKNIVKSTHIRKS